MMKSHSFVGRLSCTAEVLDRLVQIGVVASKHCVDRRA